MVHSAHGMRCIFAVGMMEHIVDLYNMHSTHNPNVYRHQNYLSADTYLHYRYSAFNYSLHINAACKVNNSGALFCWAKTYTNTLLLTTRTLNGSEKRNIVASSVIVFRRRKVLLSACACISICMYGMGEGIFHRLLPPLNSKSLIVVVVLLTVGQKPCATWNGTSCSYL